jgi:hypothetical protein
LRRLRLGLEYAAVSAIDPLRRGERVRLLRKVESTERLEEEVRDERPGRGNETLRCSYRSPDADFYCWKYGVWYNLMDCCYRHERRTYAGCAVCGQGASNLKVHRDRYLLLRPRRGTGDR